MVSVGTVIDILEHAYPPRLAASWDRGVGLACGEPEAEVKRVLFAVDAVEAIVDEAIDTGADLIVTHHPLLFSGTHSVATTSTKGRILHRLIRARIVLYSAHTNADHANPGVSDALAALLGLRVESAIEPADENMTSTGPVGTGPVGTGPVGTGPVGTRPIGTGRIGVLPAPMTLGDLGALVADALPSTAHGVRVGGDLTRIVERVAVCAGAGDDLLDAVADRVDAYVTADLRHHPAQEHLAAGGCALIDVPHWASEWPWLQQAAGVLAAGLNERGDTVEAVISTTPTDAWSLHLPSN